MIERISDILQGKMPLKKRRHKGWRRLRNLYLSRNPFCTNCGGTKKLRVHHKIPVSVDRSLELDWNNLQTLCEAKKKGVNCHLLVGHRGNFRKHNKRSEEDAAYWLWKLKGP